MTETIAEVHVYMTDISPGQFLSGPNQIRSVFMPEMLIPRADEMCSLGGMLVEYVARHPDHIKSQWVTRMSTDEWRSFSAQQSRGRDHRVCQIHTSDIAYTVVVMLADAQQPITGHADQLLSLEGPGCRLSIRIPPNWVQSKTKSWHVVRPENANSVPSPEGPVFSPGVSLTSTPIKKPIRDIQSFLNSWFDGEEAHKAFQRFELLSQRASLVGSWPASWFEFQFDKLGHRWAAVALVTSDGRVLLYADGSLLVSDQSSWYRTVKDVLESLCVSYQ